MGRDVNFEEYFSPKKSHDFILVIEDEELEVPKGNLGPLVNFRVVEKPSGEEEDSIAPSTSIRIPCWFT